MAGVRRLANRRAILPRIGSVRSGGGLSRRCTGPMDTGQRFVYDLRPARAPAVGGRPPGATGDASVAGVRDTGARSRADGSRLHEPGHGVSNRVAGRGGRDGFVAARPLCVSFDCATCGRNIGAAASSANSALLRTAHVDAHRRGRVTGAFTVEMSTHPADRLTQERVQTKAAMVPKTRSSGTDVHLRPDRAGSRLVAREGRCRATRRP